MFHEYIRKFFLECKSREEVAMVYLKLVADFGQYPGTDEEKAYAITVIDEVSQEFEDLPYETDYLDYIKGNAH